MKELDEIIEAYVRVKSAGRKAVLATVVYIKGSTFRRPGARMLITDDGQATGMISGGCLETDVYKKASDVLRVGAPVTLTYDTSSPDDLIWGFGLGCSGIIHVLMERVPPAPGVDYLEYLASARNSEDPVTLATIFDATGGTSRLTGGHLLLHKSQAQWIGIDDTRVREQVRPDAERALLSGRSTSSPYQLPDGRFHAFIEIIHPPIRLTIFGAGASAVPLVTCAKALGWQVTVVDARSTFLTEERFPEADRLLLYHPEEVVSSLQLSDRDVAVLMTHNYAHDAALLRFLLPSPVRYIGLLGPKRKGEMILEDLRKEGRAATGPQVQRLFNPVGIDLGAEEGEEIALAIVAEIQAVLAGRPAGFLRDRTDPIHG